MVVRQISLRFRDWGRLRRGEVQNTLVGGKVSVDRIEYGSLVISLGFVARYPRQPEFSKDGGYILVLELNGPMGRPTCCMSAVLCGLDVLPDNSSSSIEK